MAVTRLALRTSQASLTGLSYSGKKRMAQRLQVKQRDRMKEKRALIPMNRLDEVPCQIW